MGQQSFLSLASDRTQLTCSQETRALDCFTCMSIGDIREGVRRTASRCTWVAIGFPVPPKGAPDSTAVPSARFWEY